MIFPLFGKKKPAAPQPSSSDILAEIEARTGAAARAKELPAWALLLRSPYKTHSDATSWLGGVPHVPPAIASPAPALTKPLVSKLVAPVEKLTSDASILRPN